MAARPASWPPTKRWFCNACVSETPARTRHCPVHAHRPQLSPQAHPVDSLLGASAPKQPPLPRAAAPGRQVGPRPRAPHGPPRPSHPPKPVHSQGPTTRASALSAAERSGVSASPALVSPLPSVWTFSWESSGPRALTVGATPGGGAVLMVPVVYPSQPRWPGPCCRALAWLQCHPWDGIATSAPGGG